MMLKKDITVPGTKVVVKNVIKDGLPDSRILPYLSIKEDFYLSGNVHHANSGDILEIIKKPRKVNGRINAVRVKNTATGAEGEVYWCELRASCDHV